MCPALIVVEPAAIVRSVIQLDAGTSFRVWAALMAARSSVMCTALTMVVPAASGLSVKVVNAKVAVMEVAAVMVTVQVPVPVQPPLQPVKVEPGAGTAVSVTAVPLVKVAAQVALQEMPAGALVTVPLPVPLGLTVNVKVCSAKVAVTVVAAPSVTEQVPVPAQPPPLQPVKVEPAAGAAVSVTAVPLANVAEQVVPHEIPAGALVTVHPRVSPAARPAPPRSPAATPS